MYATLEIGSQIPFPGKVEEILACPSSFASEESHYFDVTMAVASLSLTLLAILGSVPTASAAPDVGYLEMFKTHNRTVPLTCTPGTFPAALDGTFLLPSLGQFENAGKSFQGLLDGYVCGRGARVNLKRPVKAA